MTSTGPPPEVSPCRRCKGTGREPVPKPRGPADHNFDLTAEQRAILDRLAELGSVRAASSAKRTLAGVQAVADTGTEIRVAAAEGARVGLGQAQMARGTGLSRQRFYSILTTPGG